MQSQDLIIPAFQFAPTFHDYHFVFGATGLMPTEAQTQTWVASLSVPDGGVIDEVDVLVIDNDGAATGITWYNRSLEKGRAGFDVSHRWVSTVTYELPIGKGRRFLNVGGADTTIRHRGYALARSGYSPDRRRH